MSKSTNFTKIYTIIQHEYLTKVKSKGFIISTLLGPIIMIALIAIPMLVTVLTQESTEKKIAVLDLTNKIGEKIVSRDATKYFLTNLSEDSLAESVRLGNIDGYMVIGSDIMKTGVVKVYTKGGGGLGFISSIEKNVGDILLKERLNSIGADAELVKLIESGVKVQTEKVTEEGTKKDNTTSFAAVGYVLGFIIYIMMLMYGQLVMSSVIEEKANRIIEVLVSSARPIEIMMGKVIGIGAVGLTQVLFWIIISLTLLKVGVPVFESMMSKPDIAISEMSHPANAAVAKSFVIPDISIWLAAGFLFYFLAGFFIYATLFAAIGSAVDQESDARQLSTVVTLPIIIPILFIGSVIMNPDGLLSIGLSLFPFFSPVLMIVRVAATEVPLWQIIASIILVFLTFWGCLWAAARIYRVGILMYGKKPRFSDIIKWVKLAK
jgi:ABC-2 type transport system permease protein